jgi:hypothetical protein
MKIEPVDSSTAFEKEIFSKGGVRLDVRVRSKGLEPNSEVILEPGYPGLLLLDQPHLVEPLGPMRMQVEFYNRLPDL